MSAASRAAEEKAISASTVSIDQQASFTDRVIAGLQMRVGLSAQGYPFPRPRASPEYELRKPGDKPLLSISGRFDPR